MIKAVLFDMDGTLVDSEKHYTSGTKEWLKEKGFNLTDKEINGIIGKTSSQTNEYLSSLTGLSKEEVNEYNTYYFEKVNYIDYSKYLYDDVIDTLKKLKAKNIKTVICSGSEEVLIKKFLSDLNISEYIDLYLSSEKMKHKPDPEIYLTAMKYLNITNEECIIVEDSYEGIKAGKNANCYVYARDASRYGINQENADKIIKDLREILEVTYE